MGKKSWCLFVLTALLLATGCGSSNSAKNNENGMQSENMDATEISEDAGGASDEDTVQIQLSGALEIDSVDQLAGLSQKIADEFIKTYPQVKVTVSGTSAEEAFTRLCAGEIAMAGSDRIISQDEASACESNVLDYMEFPVGQNDKSETLYLYVSKDALQSMEAYEYAGFYLQEAPKLASTVGIKPLAQSDYDSGIAKLDE